MTILHGFDFVAEISNAAFLRLIKQNLKFKGEPLNPPFEIFFTKDLKGNRLSSDEHLWASVHLIVKELIVELWADRSFFTIKMRFDNSSVVFGKVERRGSSTEAKTTFEV